VSVSASAAALTMGQVFSAQIQGNAQNSVGLSGSYTLNNQPFDQGAYALTVAQLSATAANLLTGTASDVALAYSPAAGPGQKLAHVGALSATLTPLNNTPVTLSNLDVYDDGFTLENGSVQAASFTLGGVLSVTNPSLTFSSVGALAGSAPTGTITLGADAASLFPGKTGFTAAVDQFSGSYNFGSQAISLSAGDVNLAVGKILKADATGLAFHYNSTAAIPLTVDATSVALTSPLFPGVTGTAHSLHADNTGFSLGDATLHADSATLGSILQLANLNVSVAGLTYTSSPQAGAPALTGTIGITADSAALFPGKSSFTGSVQGFAGSYDLNAQALSLSATEFDLSFGKMLKAAGTGVSLNYDGTQVSVAATSVMLTSSLFSGATGTINNLAADSTGFSIASATLTAPKVTLSELEIDNLTIGVTNLSYVASTSSLSGTISVGADTVELFPGKSSFTGSVKGFSGSYDLNSQALSLSATEFDLSFGKMLKAAGTGVSLTYDGTQVSVAATSVVLTSSLFSGATGTITNLAADSTGFSIGSATLTAPKVHQRG
jgi:hypothetical protein